MALAEVIPGSRPPTRNGVFAEFSPRAEHQPIEIALVIAATENEKKLSFLRHAFPVAIVVHFEGGPENQSEDAMDIVRKKIDHIQPFAEKIIAETSQNTALMIAADITNYTGILGPDGRPIPQAQNKPKDISDIKQVFAGMVEDIYFIEAASEIRPVNGPRDGIPAYSSVKLKPEMRRWLTTERGFRRYLKTLDTLLKSSAYLNPQEGVTHCVSPTDIAGGTELKVLRDLGVIEWIDGVEATFENALFLANAGFNRETLRPYVQNIDTVIHTWPWLQGIKTYSTRNTA
jgi:hypothetical protein